MLNLIKSKIVKLKAFKELPEQYKTEKFITLYSKMYEYMLSIPKEKIIFAHIVKRNNYIQYLFKYALCFIEAKNFYHWKNRIYSLLTEKVNSKRKYELLYNIKIKTVELNLKSDFEIFLEKINKHKVFRELPEQYKSTKFCKLYFKIYKYLLSMDKNNVNLCLNYITHFLKAKDFYHWRNRIYRLLTENVTNNSVLQYELYYGSKALEIRAITVEKNFQFQKLKSDEEKKIEFEKKSRMMKKIWKNRTEEQKKKIIYKAQIALKNRTEEQRKQQVEKRRSTMKNRTEEQKEITRNNCRQTWKNRTEEQRKASLEKHRNTLKNRTEDQKEITRNKRRQILKNRTEEQRKASLEKRRQTNYKRYGKKNVGGWASHSIFHSKFGDEVCLAIDNLLGNPEDSIYYIKSGYEYSIKDNNRDYYIDMVIPSLGIAFEADGCYWHGLEEGQVDVKGTPVEEVWEKDKEKAKAIEKAGFKLIRIREDEWKRDKEKVLNNILEEIKNCETTITM